MFIAMEIILITLAAILFGSIVAVLVLPLRFEATANVDENTEVFAMATWMAGWILAKVRLTGTDTGTELYVGNKLVMKKPLSGEDDKKPEPKEKTPPDTKKNWPSAQSITSVLKGSLKLVAGTICRMNLRASGRFRVGLGDPASTGEFMGAYYALNGMVPFLNIIVTPSFMKQEFSGKAIINGRLVIGRIVGMTIVYLPTREGREFVSGVVKLLRGEKI